MKRLKLVLFVLVFSVAIFGEQVAVLEKVSRPETVSVDAENVYLTEGTTVYIYSLDHYNLVTKFGKQGEGPREFIPPISVTPMKDSLPSIPLYR